MTPNQITALIAQGLDRELEIPFRLQLRARVKYWRDEMITRKDRQDPKTRKQYVQTLFLSMESMNSIPCGALINLPVSVSDEVPELVLAAGIFFDYCGGVDGKSPFREVRPGMYNYTSESQFKRM